MSNPDRDPTTAGNPEPTRGHNAPRGRGEESRRGERSANAGNRRSAQPEVELGGADAVEKTTYVVGEGSEPDAQPRGRYAASGAAGGPNVLVWVVGGIAVVIALVYVLGVFR